MSVSQPKYQPVNDIIITTDSCKTPISLANLVDNVNNNNLHVFYPKEDSLFKKKIDKLNLKFYLETEKYLTNQHNETKCQESLFIILFQQISLYIEEIERLNFLLQEKKGDPKYVKERVDEYIRKQKDFETKELLIKTLKESKTNSDQRLAQMMNIEDKIKKENESLKRQNKFYQDKLKLSLTNQNNENNNCQSIDNPSTPPPQQSKMYNSNEPLQQGQYIEQYNPNQSLKISKILNKKRNYSDNNPSNQNIKFQNDMNVFRNLNRYGNGNNNNTNVSNGNNSVDHNGNKLNNRLVKKKEFKIIKAVKEQLSGDIKIKSGDLIQSPRCKSPSYTKEEYKTAISKFDNELNNLITIEYFLQDFKREILQENSNNSNNILQFDYLEHNETQGNEHVKTEVMVSDLEDFDGYKTSTVQTGANEATTNIMTTKQSGTGVFSHQNSNPGSINHNKNSGNNNNKQYPLLNSVTIDLNSLTSKDNKETVVSNANANSGKSKVPVGNIRHLNSSSKKKKGV